MIKGKNEGGGHINEIGPVDLRRVDASNRMRWREISCCMSEVDLAILLARTNADIKYWSSFNETLKVWQTHSTNRRSKNLMIVTTLTRKHFSPKMNQNCFQTSKCPKHYPNTQVLHNQDNNLMKRMA